MRLRTFNLLASTSLLALASVASAQTAPSGTGATAADGMEEIYSLEEIVVTARRKEESLQDVPQVIDAVTPETLAKFNVQTFQDIAPLVPGLTLNSDGTGYQAKAALRGVNFEINSATSPTVAFYMNEAVIDANFLMQSMFDVGQIEVLRGPQGTLRGRSAPSGAITVTTHKAALSGFGGYVSVTGTNQDQIKGEGALNLPIISDVLAIRVAGLVDDNQYDHVGSINSSQDPHQHTTAERVSVTFQPNDAFSATAMYQHMERNLREFQQLAGAGSPGEPVPASGLCNMQTGPTTVAPIPCPPAGYNGPVLASGDRLGVQNHPLNVETKYDTITAQMDYRFAGQKLSYVGGYAKQDIDNFAYTDSANMLPGNVAEDQHTLTGQSQVSHELRLSSEERIAGLFDYTVGGFYSLEKPVIDLPWPVSYMPGAFGSPLGLPSPYILDQRYLVHTDTSNRGRFDERSLFGSLTWHITDKTELTGGMRYIVTKVDQPTVTNLRSDGIAALPLAALPFPNCAAGGVSSTYPGTCDVPSSFVQPSGTVLASHTQDRWTPKVYNVSLSHHFTDDLLAYVTYGTSWRRGPTAIGIQSNDPAFDPYIHLQPEESKGWEAGLKSTFLENRARANVAVYHQKYDGFIYLTPATAYLSGAGNVQNFQFTANVPATVEGVDLDTQFQITKRWSAGLAASYADGKMDGGTIPCNDSNGDGIPDNGQVTPASFTSGPVHLCTGDFAIATAPKWNANLQSEYVMPVTSSLDGYVRGLYTYYPSNDRASGEGSGFTADAYGMLNLYTGIRGADGAWDLQVFAKNATNAKKTLTYAANTEKDPVLPVNLNFGDSGYHRTSTTALQEFGVTLRYAFGTH